MTIKGAIKSIGANFLSSTGILDSLWNKDPSWRILMYHRVCKPEELSNPIQAGMYVRPETFRMHCDFLRKNSNVILIDDLIQKLLNKEKLPKRAVAITFDDGWKDNLENAFPLLKSAGLPATVFLPTDFIDTARLFWTDKIARVLALTPEEFSKYPQFLNSQIRSPEEKLESILTYLFSLGLKEREQLTQELTKNSQPNNEREFLTWDEVSTLESLGIKVGSHSHTHRLFKELSKEERINELKQSREVLKARSLLTSNVFVFPGGSHTAEMGVECQDTNYLASLKTSRNYNSGSSIFPRVGIHEDISKSENLLKYRICFQS